MVAASVGRKASLVMASQVVGAAMGYATLLVIGRYFDPASYGAFVFAMGALGLLGLLSTAGFNHAHVHFIARGVEPARALGVYLPIRAGLILAMGMVAGIGAFLWFGVLGKSISDATTIPILLAVLGLQILTAIRQTATDTWLGREQVNRTELLKTLDTALVLVSLAVLGISIASNQGRWTPAGTWGAWLAQLLHLSRPWGVADAGLALALAYVFAKAVSLLPAAWWWLGDGLRPGRWDGILARKYMAYALPVALSGALAGVLAYTDVVLLGYLKEAQDVGYYGMAQKLGTISLVVATGVAIPLLPRFSTLLQRGDQEEARRTFDRAQRFLLLVAVPAGAALVALPGPILHIAVGDRFLAAAGPLRWLGAWSILVAAMTPAGTKVMGSGRSSPAMVSSLISVGLNIPLNLWFIPDWGLGLGASGAAMATLLSTGVAYGYLRIVMHRQFSTPLWDGILARLVLAGTGTGLLWWGALAWAGPSAFARFWQLGLWGLGGALVFAGLATALGMLRAADLRAVWRLASPRGLWHELRGR